MASLFNFLFCSVLLYSYCLSVLPIQSEGALYPVVRAASPHLSDLCALSRKGVVSRKIICILCKGFDPSCFHNPTTTTSSTTTPTTSSTTTTISTSTSTTTPAPTTQTTAKTTTTTAKTEEEPEK